jgi:hypothetical protein
MKEFPEAALRVSDVRVFLLYVPSGSVRDLIRIFREMHIASQKLVQGKQRKYA